jgi:hypothetical protein
MNLAVGRPMKHSLLFFIFALVSCARVQTLNLKPQAYSERPKHIVWVQVAGFSEDHIPLLKFNVADTSFKTSLEQLSCVGKVWNYNLYELRPTAGNSFFSQLSGSKNIKGTCEDAQVPAIWSYLDNLGYSGAILENGASDTESIERVLACEQNKTLDLARTRYWKMGAESSGDKKTFHYQDSPAQITEIMAPGLYYDRSCQKGLCYSSLSNNFKTLWGKLKNNRGKSFFLVRDFNFQKALLKKDISFAKESLQEIDKIVAEIIAASDQEVLVIISGAEARPIEFPLQGKEWADFEKSGKNVVYKNSALMSPILAKGAMAENFCGIFDESEVLKRVIYRPEGKKFNWDSINPF